MNNIRKKIVEERNVLFDGQGIMRLPKENLLLSFDFQATNKGDEDVYNATQE